MKLIYVQAQFLSEGLMPLYMSEQLSLWKCIVYLLLKTTKKDKLRKGEHIHVGVIFNWSPLSLPLDDVT